MVNHSLEAGMKTAPTGLSLRGGGSCDPRDQAKSEPTADQQEGNTSNWRGKTGV